ncbi:hypothetical protein CHH67_04140 [Paenibacillus campinasensis]|uniref:Uncharacterized protein n=1 Tax=Paenibacillus campinasensis TaxID=66347 RepID=A0A268F202_9BACL|nr:hypothetical protein CHH67_04140 [Paenibacillus campinasensis]
MIRAGAKDNAHFSASTYILISHHSSLCRCGTEWDELRSGLKESFARCQKSMNSRSPRIHAFCSQNMLPGKPFLDGLYINSFPAFQSHIKVDIIQKLKPFMKQLRRSD